VVAKQNKIDHGAIIQLRPWHVSLLMWGIAAISRAALHDWIVAQTEHFWLTPRMNRFSIN